MHKLTGFIVSLILLSVCTQVNSEITIEAINIINENNEIEIRYSVESNNRNIDSIEVRKYTSLPDTPPETDVHPHNPENPRILLELNDPIDGQLYFQLGTIIDSSPEIERSHIHSTIFLEKPDDLPLECDLEINFHWLNYIRYETLAIDMFPMPPYFEQTELLVYKTLDDECILDDYEVIYTEDPIILISEHSLKASETGALEFGKTYCFRVRSFRVDDDGNTISAKSNVEKLSLDADFDVPEEPFIEYVSIVGNNERIELGIRIDDDDTESFVYEVFRAASNDADNFTRIGEFDPDDHVFIDESPPDIGSQEWYYYVTASNQECEDELNAQSQILSSIFVNAEVDDFLTGTDEFMISISWEHYIPSGYEDHFDDYALYRYINENEVEITDFSFEDESDTDYLRSDEIVGEVYYQIQAKANLNRQDIEVLSNRSYVSFSILDEDNIPKAFRPDSDVRNQDGIFVNRTFWVDFDIPPDQEHYSLKVFDRHGFLLHEETVWVKYEGWNGTLPNGEEAPAGPYVWELRYRDPGSTDTTSKNGVVNLVR